MNELLAPAGSEQALYAAINAGADAVYIGGQRFGARAYADNPDMDNLRKAIDYVHLHGKKLYLTVNTLLKEREIEDELYQYLRPLVMQGLDAVIVQDFGVFRFIREHFPMLPIHASTQMAVTGVDGALLLKNMGASRVVTARELSLSELKEIHEKAGIELESFIHGAMCYSYSGLCLFSSMLGGRSGNRGRCAGSCRQPYEVYDQNKRRLNHKDELYVLSLKDMNTLSILPEIIESGVYSLKIEGRMKSPEYVAGVVSVYRRVLDRYYEKGRKAAKPEPEELSLLEKLYSRSGSTTGYYQQHNGRNMVSFQQPAYKSELDQTVNEIHEKYVTGPKKLAVSAKIVLRKGEPIELSIVSAAPDKSVSVTGFGEVVSEAQNRPLCQENVLKQLRKTGDSLIYFQKIEVSLENNVFVAVSRLNDLRRTTITQFVEKYLEGFRRHLPEILCQEQSKVQNRADTIAGIEEMVKDNETINKNSERKVSFTCRVTDGEQLSCVLSYKEIERIVLSTEFLTVEDCVQKTSEILRTGRECIIELPYIYREHGKRYVSKLFDKMTAVEKTVPKFSQGKLSYLVRNVDEWGMFVNAGKKGFHIDTSLYAFNSYAKELYYETGAGEVTLPFELNASELRHLAGAQDELVIYGYVPLMVTAGCLRKNLAGLKHKGTGCEPLMPCTEDDGSKKPGRTFITLVDRRGAAFKAISSCTFCYNLIYNSVPVSLTGVKEKLKTIPAKKYRINFTVEEPSEIKKCLDGIIRVFSQNGICEESQPFTRGHFGRGVE